MQNEECRVLSVELHFVKIAIRSTMRMEYAYGRICSAPKGC